MCVQFIYPHNQSRWYKQKRSQILILKSETNILHYIIMQLITLTMVYHLTLLPDKYNSTVNGLGPSTDWDHSLMCSWVKHFKLLSPCKLSFYWKTDKM